LILCGFTILTFIAYFRSSSRFIFEAFMQPLVV